MLGQNLKDIRIKNKYNKEDITEIIKKGIDICTLNTVSEEQRKNYTDIDDLYINLD